MLGGDLHWIWTGYGIYQEIDYVHPLISLIHQVLTPLVLCDRFMA